MLFNFFRSDGMECRDFFLKKVRCAEDSDNKGIKKDNVSMKIKFYIKFAKRQDYHLFLKWIE